MTLAALVIACSILGGPPHIAELTRLPRLEAKADLTLWRSVAPDRLVFGRGQRPVFVRAHDAAAIETLARAGIDAERGQWLMARLDSAALLEILGGVGRTELRAAPAHRPMLDVSLKEVRASEVHLGRGVEQTRDGSGVLIGIIDTGLDLTHPAFLRPDGTSRVVAIWDQDSAVHDPPPRFSYGRLCQGAAIISHGCGVDDPTGHGTHVTGIAAGADGVAPGADIALVRSATFTHLADAVLFLTDLAEARDQPIAINISVGGHYGAHDGRTPLESYLARLLGPGKIAVAAAGNDGVGRLHLRVDLEEEPQRVSIANLPWTKPAEISIELWGAPETSVELTLELWDADGLRARVPLNAHGAEFLDGRLDLDGTPVLGAAFGAELDPDNGLARRTVLLDPSAAHVAPSGLRVALAFSGHGRLDGWISQSDYRFGVARFGLSDGPGWLAGDGDSSVTVPATSPGIVAVGSYSVRHRWLSETNEEQSVGPIPFGALSAFSSRGPTLAPAFTGPKPDLIAPGSIIASARAVGVPTAFNTLDPERVVRQGTSMAAPHVTGVIALMLEANPTLDPVRARELLRNTARVEGPPDAARGAGKLDALAAVAAAEQQAPGCSALGGPWLAAVGLLLVVRRRRRR